MKGTKDDVLMMINVYLKTMAASDIKEAYIFDFILETIEEFKKELKL